MDTKTFSNQEIIFQEKVADAEYKDVVSRLSEGLSVKQLLSIVDHAKQFVNYVRDKYVHPKSPKVACKKKCYWCCNQMVAVSPPEVVSIVHYINSQWLAKDRVRLIERLEKLDAKTRGLDEVGRIKLNVPCAFLSYGSCSIYPVRPLTCQRQTSYSIQSCKEATHKHRSYDKVVMEKAQLIASNGVIKGFYRGLREKLPKHHIDHLDLTAAVVVALKSSDVCNDWLSGKDSFRECKLAAVDS